MPGAHTRPFKWDLDIEEALTVEQPANLGQQYARVAEMLEDVRDHNEVRVLREVLERRNTLDARKDLVLGQLHDDPAPDRHNIREKLSLVAAEIDRASHRLCEAAGGKRIGCESNPIFHCRRAGRERVIDAGAIPRLPRPADSEVVGPTVAAVEALDLCLAVAIVEEPQATGGAFAVADRLLERNLDQLRDERSDDSVSRQRRGTIAAGARIRVGHLHLSRSQTG
jgi:hypothetical protein